MGSVFGRLRNWKSDQPILFEQWRSCLYTNPERACLRINSKSWFFYRQL